MSVSIRKKFVFFFFFVQECAKEHKFFSAVFSLSLWFKTGKEYLLKS